MTYLHPLLTVSHCSQTMRTVTARLAALHEQFPSLRKIIANIGWLTADKFLRMGMGVVIGAWIARYLGPDDFGVLNYAGALVGLLSSFATLGLEAVVKRDLVRFPERTGELLGTAFLLRFCAGILTYLVLALFVFLSSDPASTRSVTLIIGSGLMVSALMTADFWFQAQILSRYTVWSQNIAFLLFSLVRIGLIITSHPLVYFAWSVVAESLTASFFLCVLYLRRPSRFRQLSYQWSVAAVLLKQSWPLVFASFAVSIYMKIDQIMLGKMLGPQTVGVYSAALRCSEVWYFIPSILAASLFPTLVRSKNLGENQYKKRIQRYFDVSSALAYGLAIPGTLLAPTIVHLLFGQNYSGAEMILEIHVWASLFVFLGVAREQVFLSEGLFKFSFYTTILGGIANITLNIILIPRLGGTGSAIATVASQALAAYLTTFLYPKTIEIGVMMSRAILIIPRELVHLFQLLYAKFHFEELG